jgi:signal peptidase I
VFEPDPTPHATSPDAPRGDSRQEVRREILDFVKMVVLFLLVFWFMREWVVEGYEVQGTSMQPTLEDKERILVFKLPHYLGKLGWFDDFEAIEAGDIVVFEEPVDPAYRGPRKRFVKRVIASGGPRTDRYHVLAETQGGPVEADAVEVQVHGGQVYVNQRLIQEDYLTSRNLDATDEETEVLLPGQYFVMGDNRRLSKDSRDFGAVDDEAVIGKAVLRFWPPSRFGFLE